VIRDTCFIGTPMMVGAFDGASIPILPLCRVYCPDAMMRMPLPWAPAMRFRTLTQREESTAAKGVCEIFQRMPCVQAGGEERFVSKFVVVW
jgi:hypothetical protein